MSTNYERYLVRKPLYETFPGITNRRSMTYMSRIQVTEANYHLRLGWINAKPDSEPRIYQHVHNYDQIVMFWGIDYHEPQVLGGEIEYYLGGQRIRFNTTTSMFIPKGVKHGPVLWKEFNKPHVEMRLLLGSGDYKDACGHVEELDQLPDKADDFDFEKYVIRSPIAELGDPDTKGRTYPSMTYMSRIQIPKANYYLESSWMYAMPDPNPHVMEHVHDTEEIVIHMGSDPLHPEDLGGEMEIRVGGQPLMFDTITALFIPRGIEHGPLTWNDVRKPHIETAIMLGIGSFAEGWGGQLP